MEKVNKEVAKGEHVTDVYGEAGLFIVVKKKITWKNWKSCATIFQVIAKSIVKIFAIGCSCTGKNILPIRHKEKKLVWKFSFRVYTI